MSSKSTGNGKNGHDGRHTKKTMKKNVPGSHVPRVFSTPGVHPFDEIQWELRKASISDEKGKTIFEQDKVEVPTTWSQLATNVVVSKYFYGEQNTPEREKSVKQLIERVTRTIADWGKADGYFATDADADHFYNELTYLCVNQYGVFNSPVWFNVGLYHQYGTTGTHGNFYWDKDKREIRRAETPYKWPQASACFIQSVDDNMESIMGLAMSEAMLFKFGSGTGTDLSTLRSRREKLSGGGRPSGPLSFMRVYDQVGAVIKSGGKTRRAAKMQSLKDWHPDIVDFIEAKPREERKAWALIEQGYDGSYNGDAYASIFFQNANLSVRVSDEFMKAVEEDGPWTTRAVTTGKPVDTHKAREVMRKIAEGTHICGDPGLQYETTINEWHTCKTSGPINASNPCSEYMFLDDTACNLASMNLMKFRRNDATFDVERFLACVRIFITAQEILVDNCSYPTARIAKNSHLFRPLGLGYANLGCLIMSMGLPYDSDEGRAFAGAVTSIMGGEAYAQSARIARDHGGPFEGYAPNRESMLSVMRMHRDAVNRIDPKKCPPELLDAARKSWDAANEIGAQFGFRNAQSTVLAPTGTIGFMMDCDTTGVEPDIALVKYKLLAGGGLLKIVNNTVPSALERLGYSQTDVNNIIEYISRNDTIEGAPKLKDEHLAVFDCAFKPAKGKRAIHAMGHVKMMAAAQPFLSGAISKTVNMPEASTIDDIYHTYLEGWRMGLKALAIYRDGSKRSQPLSTSLEGASGTDKAPKEIIKVVEVPRPVRRRMSDTRKSITHKFNVANHEGYLTIGLYDDNTPGEVFITMSKEGSTVGGLMDCFGTMVSLGLQYGVPLKALTEKFGHTRFEPSGYTGNPDIPIAKSVVDYIFRWMGLMFLEECRKEATAKPIVDTAEQAAEVEDEAKAAPLIENERKDTTIVTGTLPVTGSSKSGDGSTTISTTRVAGFVTPTPTGNGGPSSPATQASLLWSDKTAVQTLEAAMPPQVQTEVFIETHTRYQSVDAQFAHFMTDAPACDNCGSITVRNGACYRCHNCGNSMGCS